MTIIKTGAKINLGLRILGKRPDGYHDLESIFYPLSFPHDELRINPTKGFGLRLVCENIAIPQRNNIVNSAYSAYAAYTGCVPGLYVRLRKNVPTGAGLGGGSADAAFFLKWLNDHCGNLLSDSELQDLGAKIGADVPFFLVNQPAKVRGKGENIEVLSAGSQNLFAVLVWPEIHVNTAWAFGAWDELCAENSLTYGQVNVKNRIPSSVGHGDGPLATDIRNDLEAAVFGRYPELVRIRDAFRAMGASDAAMSGSGSTVYGLFKDIFSARKAVKYFHATYRHVYFAPLENVGM